MHVHPTPCHIRTCIIDAISEGMKQRGEYVPVWVSQAIRDGIKQACAEHDAEQAKRVAA